MSSRLLLAAVAAAAWPTSSAFNVNEVEAYTTHELSDVTDALGLADEAGVPVAFGDFDSDQYTDVLLVSPGRDALTVLRWDHDTHTFVKGPVVDGLKDVVNVVPVDFNRDGRLDVIVMARSDATISADTHAAGVAGAAVVGADLVAGVEAGAGTEAPGNGTSTGANVTSPAPPPPPSPPLSPSLAGQPLPEQPCTTLTIIPGLTDRFGDPQELPPAFGQPLAVNVDADPATDLFGEACANDKALRGRGSRSFWLNDGKGGFDRRGADMGSAPLAHVPSPAAVDLDGDCRVDLAVPVLTPDGAVRVEVWIAVGSGLAGHLSSASGLAAPEGPAATIDLPAGVQQLSWGDVNGDGFADAVAPLCDPRHGCGANATDHLTLVLLRSHRRLIGKELCSADPAFQLTAANVTVQSLPAGWVGWAAPSSFSALPGPPVVRIGDFDLDGFPDLLAGVEDRTGSARTVLLTNRRGDALQPTYWRTTSGGSVVAVPEASAGSDGTTPDLGEAHEAHAAAFFDLDETGNLDVLLLAGSGPKARTRLLRNAFSSDDYFLKVLTLAGQCLRWCAGTEPDPTPPPYGVNQPGVTYMFASTSATGARRVYSATQLPVSAHAALVTPYTLFGLGRTNDYVNDFWVGMPSEHRRRFDAGIIPNSQLIAIPSPWDKPARWTIELYISKASMLPWVALALSAGLAAIGLVVVLLEWLERREDAREKKAMAPSLPL